MIRSMRRHSLEEIKNLKDLRRKGYSINELVKELSIPKTTVWHHIHKVQVLPRYISLLHSKRGGSKKLSEARWEKEQKHAQDLLSQSHREFVIAIAMLYWGEGTKKVYDFINSDGKMIKLYLAILRRVLTVPEECIKPTLRIFTGMDRDECLNYWARITKIPKRKFLFRLNDGGTRGRTKYGLCRITVMKGSSGLKLMRSLIEQASDELIANLDAPVA